MNAIADHDPSIHSGSEMNNDSTPRTGESKARAKIARYDSFFNQRTMRHELRKTHRPVVQKKNAIIVVKRRINAKGQYEGTDMEIHHDRLRDILQEINQGVEGLDLTARTPTASREVFFHSYEQLEAKRRSLEVINSPEDQETLEGIQAALQLIDEDIRGPIDDFSILISQRQITYEYLWALFRPNTHMYAYHGDTDQHFIAYARTFEYTEKCNSKRQWVQYGKLTCDIIVHDDLKFGRSELIFEILEFPGACSIVDLPVYPLAHYPQQESLRQTAIARGRVYAGLQLRFCQHHGVASVYLDDPEQKYLAQPRPKHEERDEEDDPALRLQINERIMIDTKSFLKSQPDSKFARSVYRRLDPEELTEDEFLICTPVLLGFGLATKAWGAFAIDRIRDIEWSKEPFNSLVLGHKQKKLISSLVMQHTSDTPSVFDDVIGGKGRGLVGLLCGNPGCGKTLTAEAVAELTHKPLYAVSAGELGTDPVSTDIRLKRILQIGERWQAVVLLDEADVFLQARDSKDISRNALVSIFLRHVEYHPGIIIFTTNLIQQMDSAFESRIHFCVKYPNLDRAARKVVWQTFLSRAGVAKGDISERDLTHLAKSPLNGRQIKNVVSTAKSIAAAEPRPSRSSGQEHVASLTPEHVRLVLDVMQDWRMAKSERTSRSYSIAVAVAGIVLALLVLLLCHPSPVSSFLAYCP